MKGYECFLKTLLILSYKLPSQFTSFQFFKFFLSFRAFVLKLFRKVLFLSTTLLQFIRFVFHPSCFFPLYASDVCTEMCVALRKKAKVGKF